MTGTMAQLTSKADTDKKYILNKDLINPLCMAGIKPAPLSVTPDVQTNTPHCHIARNPLAVNNLDTQC